MRTRFLPQMNPWVSALGFYEERLKSYRGEFEAARSGHETSHEERMERLGDIVDRLEDKL